MLHVQHILFLYEDTENFNRKIWFRYWNGIGNNGLLDLILIDVLGAFRFTRSSVVAVLWENTISV